MGAVGRSGAARCFGLALALMAMSPAADAQELEPRAYRTLPVGVNFALLSFGYSSGNVLTDPTSPIQDLDLNLRTTTLAYMRSFGLFGRSSSLQANFTYAYLSGGASLGDETVRDSRTGDADARIRLTVNLLGGPALSASQFRTYRQRRNVGVSLTVVAPTGQYYPSRLINFGSNRWSFKPELGYSSIKGHWILEGAIGVWLFTNNTNYFGGSVRRQDPIGSAQAHVSYNFKPGLWFGLDGNFYTGGETSVDGSPGRDLQRTSRVGATVSIPLRPRHSLKFSVQSGAYTRIGADFDTATLSYLYQWGGSGRHRNPS